MRLCVRPASVLQLLEHEHNDTHKSAGVVVADCLRITEGLQQGVGLQDDVFNVLHTHT